MNDGAAGTLNDDWPAPEAGMNADDPDFESPAGDRARAARAPARGARKSASAAHGDLAEGADVTLERGASSRTSRKTSARSTLPRAPRSATPDYRVAEQPAFVLHSYPWRETSLIIDVLTRDHGRVALVAKGAKRPHSALRGVLQTFQPLTLSWTGKGEVRTLTGAEWVGGMLPLAGDALLCGFYVNELLVKFCAREDPHPPLFRHYVVTMTRLAHDEPPVQVLRSFERVLLRETGYALALNRTVSRQAVVAEGRYVFDPERGVREASDEWPAQWPVLSGQTLLDMEEDDYHRPQTVTQSKALMRFLLHTYLGGTPLATRQILIDLQNL
ncbi:DNA repair protein RecO [Paraburkholderia sacchari]|uniref:DNA repair protein RecO n=1 Tax=Paraburkholderia sacchari TaxID=159450 RepID=UPI00054387D9|nr:DNA repair protein RecO [Paraburkholderia sacchari]